MKTRLLLPESPLRDLRAEDVLLLLAVCGLPWAFGGVELWAFRIASFLLVTSAAVAVARRGGELLWPEGGRSFLAAAYLLLAVAVVQVVPLPRAAVELLSPESARIQAQMPTRSGGASPSERLEAIERSALARVPEAGATVERSGTVAVDAERAAATEPGPYRISLHPGGTVERAFWFAALLAGFLVAYARSRDPNIARVYRVALFATFMAIAVSGLLQMLHWNGKVLWIRSISAGGRPFGPYVNGTHFGGAMELAVPWILGFAWLRLRDAGRNAFSSAGFPMAFVFGITCLLAGFASSSKMASVMLVASISALAILGVRSVKFRIGAILSLAVVWASAFAVVWHTALGDRFREFLEGGAGLSYQERWIAWTSAWPMVADFPLFGTGFGSFGLVFNRYMPPGEPGRWLHVHNDYLEVLLEGGVVSAVLLAWLAIGYFGVAIRRSLGRKARSTREVDVANLGLILGLLSLSIHAVVDFNHQIPANALLFVATAALAARGAGGSRERLF